MNLVERSCVKVRRNSSPSAGVRHLGPLLLCPKEACPATGLGRVRNGQDEDEDQSGAGGKSGAQAPPGGERSPGA